MIGLGAPIIQVYDVTVQAASGTITLTPANGAVFTKGRLRIKSSAPNAATTVAIGNITVIDGTNTVIVKQAALAATAAGTNFDLNFEILTDLQATSISFSTTLGGATTAVTINSEFFANP